jgi:hypothetical protein
VALFAGWSLVPRLPGGDEPHYLIITQSLLKDGDLQIENNHAARDFAAYYAGDIRPDFKVRGQNGAIYSIHAPGTSAVVLPAFALFGYRGAQATIACLAALASAFIWYAGWLATGDRAAAWFAWLAVALAPTFVIQSVTIFPDGVALFIVSAVVTMLLRLGGLGSPVSTGGLVAVSALLAVLPWLHTRLALLLAGFVLIIAWLVWMDTGRSIAERRKRLLSFAVLPAASTTAWLGFFQIVYGTPNPVFPYGEDRGTSLGNVPGGLLGLLFDEQFGLLAYSPVLAAAFVGLFAGRRTAPAAAIRIARATSGVALGYLAVSASYWMWWAGVPAPPARFAAAVLPAFAVPIAIAWRTAAPAMRAVWVTLTTASVATTVVVVGADRGRLGWNTRGIRANWLDWMSGVADLSRGWPSFFWRLDPASTRLDGHFTIHVFAWLAIFAATAAVFVLLVRRRTYAVRRLAPAWWFTIALMMSIQCGWWFSGANGLAAAPSQVAVLNGAAAGRRVLQVRPFSVGPQRQVADNLHIRATRADEVGETDARWLPLLGVPAGEYAVTVSLRRPRAGTLALRIGRSVEPLRRLAVEGVTQQTLALSLPAGASALFLEPDPALAASAAAIDLTPLKLAAPSTPALTSARLGSADLFFQTPGVYVEPEWFWVRGGQSALFTVAAGRGRSTIPVTVINGEAANEPRIEWGEGDKVVRLAPLESHTIDVALSPDGLAVVTVTSPSGFRPSDDGVREDRRYLGVRVKVGG